MTKMIIELPFQGFYGTLHESELDAQLELFLEENDLSCDDVEVNWRKIRNEYAKNYVECFSNEVGGIFSNIVFESLYSPREYNFENDRIFVYMNRYNINILSVTLRKNHSFIEYIHEKLKPRSGFIPYYSSDIDTWGSVDKWEQPQLSLMVRFVFEKYLEEWGGDKGEFDLLESYLCNGGSSLVASNTTMLSSTEGA